MTSLNELREQLKKPDDGRQTVMPPTKPVQPEEDESNSWRPRGPANVGPAGY